MTDQPEWFRELLKRYKRIAIAGAPRCGKTTLALTVRDRPVLSTDSYINVAWENAPEIINDAVSRLPSFLLEGIQVGRCLRKGLKVDAVIYLDRPHVPLTKGQETMRKGCRKIYNDWLATLDRDATISEVPSAYGAP